MILAGAEAILFDKDGTLFDFHATWSTWAAGVIAELAAGNPDRAEALADAWDYDLRLRRFRPTSPVVAGTNREVAELAVAALGDRDVDAIEALLTAHAARAPLCEVVPLPPFLSDLKRRGLRLGVMTNDAERAAREHLERAGALDLFDFVAGSDTGFGAKPDPAPLLAFAERAGVAPDRAVMVGDSAHDLRAGRAARMRTVGVLTGTAGPEELAPHADLVLASIAELPEHL